MVVLATVTTRAQDIFEALKSNDLMMHRLQRMRMFNTYEEDEELLEDLLLEELLLLDEEL